MLIIPAVLTLATAEDWGLQLLKVSRLTQQVSVYVVCT